ncbi:hypothetical protein ACP70R_025150 [Stipagrostis hirtigluma subsp. patula]
MARTRRVLPLLLVLLLPGAVAAATGLQCQPEALADGVSLFCASRQPTEWCCQELAHAASAGGAACLCRLAAERPLVEASLNATDLLALYAACASPPGHGAAPTFACGGGGEPSPAVREAPRTGDGSGCGTAGLADQMGLFCGPSSGQPTAPSFPCCEAVVGSVRAGAGGVPCFCRVARLPSSAIDVGRIADVYAACRGLPAGATRDVLTRMCQVVH